MIRKNPLIVMTLVLIAGCGGHVGVHRKLKPEFQAPPEGWAGVARIVVMPPDNWTGDVGLEYITWYRAVANELIRERGYEPVPLVDVNRFLLKNKFTVAGEAGIYSSSELAKHFGADAILYWSITGDGPRMIFQLEKADATVLWSSGDIALGLEYVAPVSGRFHEDDKQIVLALGEFLRALPARVR